MLGEAAGMTAGRGIDGLGETDRCRIDCAETDPNEERRLCVVAGGFMGNASDCGVPGAEGPGEPMAWAWDGMSFTNDALPRKSGGAGLLWDTLRVGRSIFEMLLCLVRSGWPSFVLSV